MATFSITTFRLFAATSIAAASLLSAPAFAQDSAADTADVNPFALPRAEACALAEAAPTDSNLEACYSDLPAALPACPTEDSTDCYWLAESRGNGKGRSFINIAGAAVFLD
jgi:hypothetical protein